MSSEVLLRSEEGVGGGGASLPRDTNGTSRQEGVGGGGAELPRPRRTLPLPRLGGQPELHLGRDL